MKCMKCNQNEASVYYEQNVNGKVTKLALCPECAAAEGIGTGDMFGGFNLLGNFFDLGHSPVLVKKEQKKCPVCGCSFDDIVKSGTVGCSECYKTFSSELAPTVRRIHGSAVQTGRRPVNSPKDEKPKDKLFSLRDELQKAIKAEEYEKAAKIRDMIKAEEAKGEANNE